MVRSHLSGVLGRVSIPLVWYGPTRYGGDSGPNLVNTGRLASLSFGIILIGTRRLCKAR